MRAEHVNSSQRDILPILGTYEIHTELCTSVIYKFDTAEQVYYF